MHCAEPAENENTEKFVRIHYVLIENNFSTYVQTRMYVPDVMIGVDPCDYYVDTKIYVDPV